MTFRVESQGNRGPSEEGQASYPHAEILIPIAQGYNRATQIIAAGGIGVLQISANRAAYGFAVDVTNPESVARINLIKGRPEAQAPVFGLLPEQVKGIIDRQFLVAASERIAELWDVLSFHNIFLIVRPQETFVSRYPHLITYHDRMPTVGLMVFANEELYRPIREIYRRLLPLSPEAIIGGTSANLHGQPMCFSLTQARSQLGDQVDFYLDTDDHPWGRQRQLLDTAAPMVMVTPEEDSGPLIVHREGLLLIADRQLTLTGDLTSDQLLELFYHEAENL